MCGCVFAQTQSLNIFAARVPLSGSRFLLPPSFVFPPKLNEQEQGGREVPKVSSILVAQLVFPFLLRSLSTRINAEDENGGGGTVEGIFEIELRKTFRDEFIATFFLFFFRPLASRFRPAGISLATLSLPRNRLATFDAAPQI